MAEIAGVAATAAQLAVTCFSLLDLMRKIKGGSSTLKRYHQQLQELRSLSDSVSKNPLLQTPEVGEQTQTILSIIEDSYLSSLLQKGRWLRTWGLIYRERDIIDVFTVLERQKTTLSLAIEEIQSRVLHQIQSDISTMAPKSSRSSRRLKAKHANQIRDEKGKSLPQSSDSTALVHRKRRAADREDFDVDEAARPGSSRTYTSRSSASGQHMDDDSPPYVSGQDGQPYPGTKEMTASFNHVIAGEGINQILGPYSQLHSLQKKGYELGPIKTRFKFQNCMKYGRGSQINGPDFVDYSGNYTVSDLPAISGEWDNCFHLPENPKISRPKGSKIPQPKGSKIPQPKGSKVPQPNVSEVAQPEDSETTQSEDSKATGSRNSDVFGTMGTQFVGGRFWRAGFHPDDDPKYGKN